MAYPPHALLQFGGTLSAQQGPSEIWTCGVRCCAIGGGGPTFVGDEDAALAQLVPKLKTWYTSAAAGMAITAQLAWVKLNNITGDGSYQDAVTHQQTFTAVNGAKTTTNAVPSFCSLVYTWETGFTRGLAHRGRIYPPNYCYGPVNAGVASADVTAQITAAKNLLSIFTGTTDGASLVLPYVVSSGGVLRPITGVSIDNVWDVQRRRKNRLTATRTTGAWP